MQHKQEINLEAKFCNLSIILATMAIRVPSKAEIDSSYEDALRAVTGYKYEQLSLVENEHEQARRFERELAKNAYLERNSPAKSEGNLDYLRARYRLELDLWSSMSTTTCVAAKMIHQAMNGI